jgi:hypothetical protein
MQTPQYKVVLANQIEEEKKKRASLLAEVENEERRIITLQRSGCELLKCRLNEIGITAKNQKEMFDRANEILVRNKELHEQEQVLNQELDYYQIVHDQLLKKYHDSKPRRDAKGKKQILQEKMFDEYLKNSSRPILQQQEGSSLSAIEKALASSFPRQSTPSPATSSLSANSNSPVLAKSFVNMKDTFQIPNANDRINSMIVAALNNGEQQQQHQQAPPATSTPTAVVIPIKQEKPKRKYERKKPLIEKTKPVVESIEKSVTSETITNTSRVIKRPEQQTDYKPVEPITAHPATVPNPISANNILPPESQELDKKPITLTLVIDRRDNSASVKSPSKSSPKHELKRKNSYADDMPKKFRAKYSEHYDASLKPKLVGDLTNELATWRTSECV